MGKAPSYVAPPGLDEFFTANQWLAPLAKIMPPLRGFGPKIGVAESRTVILAVAANGNFIK
jgi:hypothetical protein